MCSTVTATPIFAPPRTAAPTLPYIPPTGAPIPVACVDVNSQCQTWARSGECMGATATWIQQQCSSACTCSIPGRCAVLVPPPLCANPAPSASQRPLRPAAVRGSKLIARSLSSVRPNRPFWQCIAPALATAYWAENPWGACSATCGTGLKYRAVTCTVSLRPSLPQCSPRKRSRSVWGAL
jgi:hypothetical protein